MHSREFAWARLGRPLDLLVIGGGVTGAGLLLEAARRGLNAALVERDDFASGTSSRSSKLVHGGLRYLGEGKVRLTRDSVRERQALLREAPGLVEPLPFLMPQYRGKGPSKALTQLGLAWYDRFAGERRRGYLDAPEAFEREPAIKARDLLGAHLFLDATTDDARLVLRLLSEAESLGGVSLNYAEAVEFQRNRRGRVEGAIVRDNVKQRDLAVSAKVIVNATGVFSDELREKISRRRKLRPLRGSHILLQTDRLPLQHAVVFAHPQDGRPVFAYPWMGLILAGTTDVDHTEDLYEPSISRGELDYLLGGLAVQFPRAQFEDRDVVSTFAGIRPVVSRGHGDPSHESRDHLLLEERGLVTITGGKLTTFRPMALAVLKAVAGRLGKRIDFEPRRIFNDARATTSTRLNGRYGTRAGEVLENSRIGDENTIAGTQTTWAELRYALRSECVMYLDDLLLRRTRLGLQLPDGASELLGPVCDLCVEELGWDAERRRLEVSSYMRRIRTHYGVPQ